MIANYHTHTWRCNHAVGTEEEYVRNALTRGLQILGFSDHTPQFFPGDYYSYFRMRPEQLQDYCDTVRGLQKAYAGQLRIPLGLEVEYYPTLFPRLLSVLRDAGIEYLLLGQHFVGDEMGEPYSGRATADEAVLRRYCDQTMEAMQTGLFTYLAHPDLIRFEGEASVYRQHMGRLCREARSCGMALELNMLGKGSGRHYPNPVFWELAAEEGCDVILGCDAHSPEQLLNVDVEWQLLELVSRYGLKLLETVPLRPIL